ncbi:MAG: DNA polymerase III subunit gamma/tau [Candidatus Omnitrophota bacterium]
MSYIVFARKWRPQAFEEVIGEEHITSTLKNAISAKRVAHAYIFTGPRGIGKTSVARIFAKALNCEKAPTTTPCNKCVSCKAISSGTSMDVIEIDGASNNSVDQIRELRENIKFSPSYGNYKIYIIDEVHMLSMGAFNALLKTLEEPPAHAKFVFATTNPEKVPSTVLSRCQRFDFVRIPFNLIVEKLKKIITAEKLNISEEAIFTIARASDGSLRDAESILDQLASFSSGKISGEDVINLLGMIEEEELARIVDSIYEKDTRASLQAIDEMISKGKDISQFIIGLMNYMRNMMVLAVSSSLRPLIDFPDNYVDALKEQVKKFKIEELLYIFYTLSATLKAVKRSGVARFILEAAFIKLSMRSELISLADVAEKLSNLESNVKSGVVSREAPLAKREDTRYPSTPPGTGEIQDIPRLSSGQARYAKDVKADEPAPENHSPKSDAAISAESVKRAWPSILQNVKSKKISMGSYLSEGNVAGTEGSSIILSFAERFNFHKEVLENSTNKKFVEDIISEALGTNIQVKFITVRQGEEALRKAFGEEDAGSEAGGPEGESDAADESIIQSALNMFNGKIVKIRENNARNEQD